jgi:NAD(P)H dehydrogenase (quinone)
MEILVLFDSKYGNTYALAKAIAEGIQQVDGMTARLRKPKETTPMEFVRADERRSKFLDFVSQEVPEATLDDLIECEGLALGSPTRYGNMSPAMGNFIESTGPLWLKGSLIGKVAGVFCSTSSLHGGQETTLVTMMFPLSHLGYILVPMGYTDMGLMTTTRGGTPYGPTSVSGPTADQGPDETELQIARAFGRRLAETTKKLRS